MLYVSLSNFLCLAAVLCTTVYCFSRAYGLHLLDKDSGYTECGRTPIKPSLDTNKQAEVARPYSWPWISTPCDLCVYSVSGAIGIVIGRRWVLTSETAEKLGVPSQVRTGLHSWFSVSSEGTSDTARYYNVTHLHKFPYVRNGTRKNGEPWTDYAPVMLLELSTDIDFDERVQPVCLASNDQLLLHQQPSIDSHGAWMAGWTPRGLDRAANITQVHLRTVNLAAGDVPTRYVVTETRRDIYMTNAPLMKEIDGRWLLYGMLIEDWYGYPAYYARVPYYCEWIEETTRGEVKCQSERVGDEHSSISYPSNTTPVPASTPSDAHSECGQTPIEPILTPSNEMEMARPHSWPWITTICDSEEGSVHCTGTVVGRRWVLTVLRWDRELNPYSRVRTGVYNTSDESLDPARHYRIARVHKLPYERNATSRDGTSLNDNSAVALLELSTDIHFDEQVQPVCLASNDHLLLQPCSLSHDVWVAGWRSKWSVSIIEPHMTQLHLRFVRLAYGDVPFGYFLDKMDWTHNYMLGAPLMKKVGDRWLQYGVGLSPVYHSRVPYYCDWVEKTTRSEVKCQTERLGELPSPIPAPTPIEETKPDEVQCNPTDSAEIPLSSRSPYLPEKPRLVFADLYTLALYRDNGTRACYSRVPLHMCQGGLHPYNQTRKIVNFVCFYLQITPSTPPPSAACLPGFQFFTNSEHDEHDHLFAVSIPEACVRDTD